MSDDEQTPEAIEVTELPAPPPQPEAPQADSTVTAISPEGRPAIRIDPAMVAETLQRKNAQLMSQIVYDNAVLETALETAQRRIQELEAQNAALKQELMADKV